MNVIIEKVYKLIKIFADKWHKDKLDLFELDELSLGDIGNNTIKLLYHNYQIWHFIELYTSPDSGTVLFVYDGGIKHNRLRNDAIEALDVALCDKQAGTGKINSETIGSIIDRIGILYIKVLHLKSVNDERASLIQKQLDVLVNCASELMDDMQSGERQCALVNRFKIEYSEK